ncbi:hypothetical protein NFI96_005240 [Prochilodus magdalenae]|nr:hypothetical protein NFI96_005240 [Prochilodus magdalenae]
MKFLNYSDKVRTMKAARDKGTILFEGRQVMFFPDILAELHKQQKRFDTVKKELQSLNISDLLYGIVHPAMLCVTFKRKRSSFSCPVKARKFVQGLRKTQQQHETDQSCDEAIDVVEQEVNVESVER